MRTPISFGVVGSSDWGGRVAQTVEALPGTDLRWFCGGGASSTQSLRPIGRETQYSDDFSLLLDDESLDAIVVAVPTAARYEMARLALEADKHVFVQSPVAASSKEAWDLVRQSGKRGCVLAAGDTTTFQPALQTLKRMLHDGALGDVFYAYANRQTFDVGRDDPLWGFGGDLVSSLLYLFDDQPVEVIARGESYVENGVADVVFCYLKFATGISAHLHLSRLDPLEHSRLTIVGSRAMAVIDDLESERKLTIHQKSVDHRPGAVTRGDVGDIISPFVSSEDPLRIECERFVSSVRSAFARPTAAPAAAAVEILEGLQRSLEQNGTTEPLIAKVSAPVERLALAVATPESG